MSHPDTIAAPDRQLTVEGVSKSFGGVQVLTDIGFSVPVSGLSGLIGPNGAGKSTLFSVVSGFQPGDAGRAHETDSLVINFLKNVVDNNLL